MRKILLIISFLILAGLVSLFSSSKELLLFGHICCSGARHFFTQAFVSKENPLSSWTLNQLFLSQIPTMSKEANQLIQFLEKRWLAKSCGFYSSEINWICPTFGIPIQVSPMTTNCYARDPGKKFSKAYENRMKAWKQSLPHDFPLILTRPFDLREYLPNLITVSQNEDIKRIKGDERVIVDLTDLFENRDPAEWPAIWEPFRLKFLQSQAICIQRLKQGEIGAIRILDHRNENYQFLIDWISCFGLAANQVEIDRWPSLQPVQHDSSPPIPTLPLEEFASYLDTVPPQKNLMVQGTLQLLKGLFEPSMKDKWDSIIHCPTRASIAKLSLFKIRKEFERLAKEEGPFFETASRLEQVHANLLPLIEILSPYQSEDFAMIYRDLLTTIPAPLKSFTSCGLHTSGMTSVAGIMKAVGKTPRVLYGGNAYFECIRATAFVSKSASIDDASEEDWKEADLIFAQFNPVWDRDISRTGEYKLENIGEIVHKALNARGHKPLTLAIDCTLDLIDSSRVGQLLEDFQEAVQEGALNIICFRSGLKFDLFGMDNYCGAPIYMIHNRDSKWAPFDFLLTDPVLQTDRLSLNWFCLAYANAAPHLELYRKQIFDNTRALLNKIPPKLYDPQCTYRMIPVDPNADPSFIDMHVYGPFHKLRAAVILTSYFYLRCMESGHPIFFRRSFGFYHLNLGLLFGENSSTIRLTLGLDPDEVDLLADCFTTISKL